MHGIPHKSVQGGWNLPLPYERISGENHINVKERWAKCAFTRPENWQILQELSNILSFWQNTGRLPGNWELSLIYHWPFSRQKLSSAGWYYGRDGADQPAQNTKGFSFTYLNNVKKNLLAHRAELSKRKGTLRRLLYNGDVWRNVFILMYIMLSHKYVTV